MKKPKKKIRGKGRPREVQGLPADLTTRVGEGVAKEISKAAERGSLSRSAVVRRILSYWTALPSQKRREIVEGDSR